MCFQMNPGDRSSLENVRTCIGKKEKKQLTIQLGLSQAIALETYHRKIVTGATQNNLQLPENDGAAACTFIYLRIPEKSLELQPVSDEEIAYTFILTTPSTFFLITFLDDLKTR